MAKSEMIGYIHWLSIMECTIKVTTKDGKDQIMPFDMGANGDNYRRMVGFTSREAKLVVEDGEVKDLQPLEEPAPAAAATTPPAPAAPTRKASKPRSA